MKVSARFFPIGFIISVDNSNFNPHEFYIDGNWERIKGKVIVGVDENQSEFNVTGKIGGSKYMQKHKHLFEGLPNYGNQAITWGSDKEAIAYSYLPSSTATYLRSVAFKESGIGDSENLQPYQTAYVWKLISYSN